MAASVWLGGLVFVIVVMRAPVQELGERTALEGMLVRFRRRYKGLLIATVAALAVSGVVALAARHAKVDAVYVILLIVKILISVGVVALLWYAAFVREEPRRPTRAEEPAAPGEPAGPSEDATMDVDFFFRPKKHHALVQLAVVGATLVAILLGVVVARRGAWLAARPEEEPARAEEPAD
jgi:hypothetical protein